MNSAAQTPLVVLITGCSSGIGQALALEFHGRGYRVWATARQVERLEKLADLGMMTVALDVTQGDSIAALIDQITAQDGRLDYLINNAGYGLMGSMLDLEPEAIEAQFRTNVYAPLALCQAVAPLMRSQGRGVIVNLGSISGVLTTPFAGAYCASKAALHALSDALRLELDPFGIAVVTVQPGGIQSNFGTAASRLVQQLPAQSWYQPVAAAIHNRAIASQTNATPTADFAQQLVTAVTQPQPPAVVRLGQGYWPLFLLQRLLPTALLDRLLTKKFSLDRLP
nr:SDR family oxidoreductase [Prochlorothrix hollandica]